MIDSGYEWFCPRWLLDMIWIKVVLQQPAVPAPLANGCIKINTIHGLDANTLSFMWLYAES